ncbi:MAG: 16S rRNA (uracil(1498)-N(3))-methyltransferase [Candidatus Sedimenticola endophacoides]
MRRPRIHTPQPLCSGELLELEEGAARHLLQVLRLQRGAPLTLFNGDGDEYAAQISDTSRRRVEALVGASLDPEPEPALRIHLGIGISKGERMDFAVQKATELGVDAITPLLTERCVVRLNHQRMAKRLDHWHQIAIAACEQCGRARLPRIHDTLDLSAWLGTTCPTPGVLLDHRATGTLGRLPPPGPGVRLLVGPEGGLSEPECRRAGEHGFTGIRLGPRVLRTETAPLAAIAAMQTLWGDFRQPAPGVS